MSGSLLFRFYEHSAVIDVVQAEFGGKRPSLGGIEPAKNNGDFPLNLHKSEVNLSPSEVKSTLERRLFDHDN